MNRTKPQPFDEADHLLAEAGLDVEAVRRSVRDLDNAARRSARWSAVTDTLWFAVALGLMFGFWFFVGWAIFRAF